MPPEGYKQEDAMSLLEQRLAEIAARKRNPQMYIEARANSTRCDTDYLATLVSSKLMYSDRVQVEFRLVSPTESNTIIKRFTVSTVEASQLDYLQQHKVVKLLSFQPFFAGQKPDYCGLYLNYEVIL